MSHTPCLCVIPNIHKRLSNKKAFSKNALMTNVTFQAHSGNAIEEEVSMKDKHCKDSLRILNAEQIKLKGRSEEKENRGQMRVRSFWKLFVLSPVFNNRDNFTCSVKGKGHREAPGEVLL